MKTIRLVWLAVMLALVGCGESTSPPMAQRLELCIVDRITRTEDCQPLKCTISGDRYTCTRELTP